jgi:hypothetical protein
LISAIGFVQPYSIDWYKVAGGAGTSTGGVHAVSGTIGQPDAGTAMTGGSYSLTGGFWSLMSVVQTPGLPNLTISTWRYIADANVRHLGPMAQDFYSAFNVGMEDKHISMVDADGVALAAIQGLNQKVEARGQKSEDRIQKLEMENMELKQTVNERKKLMSAMNQEINGGAR